MAQPSETSSGNDPLQSYLGDTPALNEKLKAAGLPEVTCDVCGKEPSVGVAAVPGVPMSVAYGSNCLAANAHPYWILVANTAMCGGYDHTVEEWRQMVDDTLEWLGKDRERFDADVATLIAEAGPAYAGGLEQALRENGAG